MKVLKYVGGADKLFNIVLSRPKRLEATYSCLLEDASVLDLRTKQAWLSWRLESVVESADAKELSLVAIRTDLLQGLCDHFGIDEQTGQLTTALPQPLQIAFAGEDSVGDGLRREWFDLTTKEILDPNSGLFVMKDGRTLQPNPNSATAAGADHLPHFALLGRISGLALYHREPLDAQWSNAFVKAAIGFEISPDDIEWTDPELYQQKVRYLQGCSNEELADLELTFTDTVDEAIVYQSTNDRLTEVELKPNGAEIPVTMVNLSEYLQLFAQQRLVGATKPQVEAFRNGLAVFVEASTREILKKCCTIAELQVLICGNPEINVHEWEQSARYLGGCGAETQLVQWLWAVVEETEPVQRSQLLHFCTGSARPPATGFNSLMGYGGQQQCFTVQQLEDGPDRLPTAATCSNTLRLPRYTSKSQLQSKLQHALASDQVFDEGAVAG